MVLSNAERQARYRKRLKDAARFSVTPEVILAVAKRLYEFDRFEGDGLRDWDDYLAWLKKGRRSLFDMLPDNPSDEDFDTVYAELSEQARAVAAIVEVIRWPGGRPTA